MSVESDVYAQRRISVALLQSFIINTSCVITSLISLGHHAFSMTKLCYDSK
jgi:hypothetical protein